MGVGLCISQFKGFPTGHNADKTSISKILGLIPRASDNNELNTKYDFMVELLMFWTFFHICVIHSLLLYGHCRKLDHLSR